MSNYDPANAPWFGEDRMAYCAPLTTTTQHGFMWLGNDYLPIPDANAPD